MNKFSTLVFASFLVIVTPSCSAKVANNSCNDIQLQVLGSGGPEIDDGLVSSSYLVWINDKATLMIDAGGGSSLNFEKSAANFNHLKAILLTHLHVDHSAALPVYVKAGYFTGREQNLFIFGPPAGADFPATENFVKALFSDQQASAWPYLSDNLRQQQSTDFLIKATSVRAVNDIWSRKLSETLSISAIQVTHGAIPAIAWRVDYGSCSITFSGDMNGTSGHLQKLAKDTLLLVANNAIPENAHPIAKKLHMTPSTIATIANQVNPPQLMLSHFMNRSKNLKSKTQQSIAENYTGEIIFAEDLVKYQLKHPPSF